jgi:hypothetical protein
LAGTTHVSTESVLAARGVGLQLTSTFDSGARTVRFLEAQTIRSIIINEGIQGCTVQFYLAVIATGQKEMVLVFPHSQPRLAVIVPIFRDLHALMTPQHASAPAPS